MIVLALWGVGMIAQAALSLLLVACSCEGCCRVGGQLVLWPLLLGILLVLLLMLLLVRPERGSQVRLVCYRLLLETRLLCLSLVDLHSPTIMRCGEGTDDLVIKYIYGLQLGRQRAEVGRGSKGRRAHPCRSSMAMTWPVRGVGLEGRGDDTAVMHVRSRAVARQLQRRIVHRHPGRRPGELAVMALVLLLPGVPGGEGQCRERGWPASSSQDGGGDGVLMARPCGQV